MDFNAVRGAFSALSPEFSWRFMKPAHDSPKAWAAWIAGGGWPMSPLGFSPDFVGLAIASGPIEDWRVLFGERSMANTLCSSAGLLVPATWYWGLEMQPDEASWKSLAASIHSHQGTLLSLHQALSGTEVVFRRAMANLRSSAVAQAMLLRPGVSRVEALESVWTELDPVQSSLYRFLGGRKIRLADLPGEPRWPHWRLRSAMVNAHSRFSLPLGDERALVVAHAHALMTQNSPQLDCSGSGRNFNPHSHSTGRFNDIVAALVLRALAQGSTDEQLAEWKQEPFWLPIDARARKLDDWFLAFMESAAAYDGRDEPETAWHMLGWGAFWVGHYKHGAWRAFFDAALALAERRGWEDAARALRFQAEMAGLE